MLALLAFEVTVYRHQEFYRMRNNLTAPVTRTIFHNITRQHLDDGIINCAKYFINYFFYKFGLEVLHSCIIEFLFRWNYSVCFVCKKSFPFLLFFLSYLTVMQSNYCDVELFCVCNLNKNSPSSRPASC